MEPDNKELSPGRLKRLRNLKKFSGWTDEQIQEYWNTKPVLSFEKTDKVVTKSYEERLREKVGKLKETYVDVDMNDANDAESIFLLARLQVQAEDIDIQIRDHTKSLNARDLKNLGDFQRSIIMSINDAQEKLGITRKVRKEKESDDIPKYLAELRIKAKEFWDRKTTKIECPYCQIELSRYWINFPSMGRTIKFELECWKCHEKIIYVE